MTRSSDVETFANSLKCGSRSCNIALSRRGTITLKTMKVPKISEDQIRHRLQKDLDRRLDNIPGSKGGWRWVGGFEDMVRQEPEPLKDSRYYKTDCICPHHLMTEAKALKSGRYAAIRGTKTSHIRISVCADPQLWYENDAGAFRMEVSRCTPTRQAATRLCESNI